jgi:hypothetical protein
MSALAGVQLLGKLATIGERRSRQSRTTYNGLVQHLHVLCRNQHPSPVDNTLLTSTDSCVSWPLARKSKPRAKRAT